MRFRTIWSMSGMTLAEKLRRTRDWATQETAARLPLRLRFWVTMQEIGRATMDSPNVPATTLDEVLRKLDTPVNLK